MWSEVVSRRNRVALLLVFVVCLKLPATATAILANRTNTGRDGGTVLALAIDPRTSTTLYAGTAGGVFKTDDGVIKSTDGGGSWRAVNAGLTSPSIAVLAIDPKAPATIYVGVSRAIPGATKNRGVFKSVDGGATWRATNAGLTWAYVNSLVIDPHTPSIIYAAIWSAGVYKSTDGGRSWHNVSKGLTSSVVNILAIDSRAPMTLYAGCERGGVFKSVDGGGSWHAINAGLTW